MFFVACSNSTAPTTRLVVSFRVEPGAAQAGDSLLAVLTISNQTPDTVTLFSGSSCVNTLRVLRDGELVTMRGANFGCLGVGTQFPIPPGGSLVRSYHLVAMLQEETQPFEYVVPPRGRVRRAGADAGWARRCGRRVLAVTMNPPHSSRHLQTGGGHAVIRRSEPPACWSSHVKVKRYAPPPPRAPRSSPAA